MNPSSIESAFIKANTYAQLIAIETPPMLLKGLHHQQQLTIKMEVDTDPPLQFHTETRYLLNPIPFAVSAYTKPCLFAGKVHALLCRPWKIRVKGRDWYDFIWYIQQRIPLDNQHLQARLRQSEHWPTEETLSADAIKQLLVNKIEQTNFEEAKKDIRPFIKDPAQLTLWSGDFFKQLTEQLVVTTPG